MQLNYHELTMNEPRNSKAKHQQFLLICFVMAGGMGYSMLMAGAFSPVEIQQGVFPGGDFVYKFTSRDYAAAPSLTEYFVRKDLNLTPTVEMVDKMYELYLDNPSQVQGRQQRFACGYLTDYSEDGIKLKENLLSKNDKIVPPTDDEILSLPAMELWTRLRSENQTLPSVKAAVLNFPYTAGFISDLVLSFKVIPAMRKYVANHAVASADSSSSNSGAAAIVILTTCSSKEQMCTHYAPLVEGEPFLLGRMDGETYMKEKVTPEPWINWHQTFLRLERIYSYFFGKSGTQNNDEL